MQYLITAFAEFLEIDRATFFLAEHIDQHCVEIKCYHAGYSEHTDAWPVRIFSKGT